MGSRCEGKRRLFTPGPNHRIVLAGIAHRNRLMGDVGQGHQDGGKFFFNTGQRIIQLLNPFGDLPHFFDSLQVFLLLFFQAADPVGNRIPSVFQGLGLLEDFPAVFIQRLKGIPGQILTSKGQTVLDPSQPFPDQFQIQHDLFLILNQTREDKIEETLY